MRMGPERIVQHVMCLHECVCWETTVALEASEELARSGVCKRWERDIQQFVQEHDGTHLRVLFSEHYQKETWNSMASAVVLRLCS